MTTYKYVHGAQEVQAELLAYPAKVEQRVVRNSLAAGARVVRDTAKQEVPKRSGRLAKTIRVKTRARDGQVTAGVRVGDLKQGVFYAHMVLGGTQPHAIPIRRAKALAVGQGVSGSQVVPRRSVQHPGAKADDFMGRAKASIPRALEVIVQRAKALIDKLNQEVMAR
jgi:HK97 gp10 family phage protein